MMGECKRVTIDRADLLAALDIYEDCCPDAAVGFSTIINDGHMAHPFGVGFAITLHSAAVPAAVVFEKGHSFKEAMSRAVGRLARREAGERGA